MVMAGAGFLMVAASAHIKEAARPNASAALELRRHSSESAVTTLFAAQNRSAHRWFSQYTMANRPNTTRPTPHQRRVELRIHFEKTMAVLWFW